MHNAVGHGSTFDLLFKQRGRSLLFSELQSTPRLENKWGFVLRLAPSMLSRKPPQHWRGPEGTYVRRYPVLCSFAVGFWNPKWANVAPRCGTSNHQKRGSFLGSYPDTYTGLQRFVKRSPASPGQSRVQLILHAWAKYHLCLFGNKGGTC